MGQQEQILNARPKILSDIGIWTEESDPTNPFSIVCCEHGLISLGEWDFTPSNFWHTSLPTTLIFPFYPHLSHFLSVLPHLPVKHAFTRSPPISWQLLLNPAKLYSINFHLGWYDYLICAQIKACSVCSVARLFFPPWHPMKLTGPSINPK